ncbi:MAG: hypothetical protein FWG14_10195 [Peptococcaceae bacterium]|nr:hypothetical protein [Peptococcaceae bacterium]
MNSLNELGALRQNMLCLCRRTATDKDFRGLCLADPARAYVELTGTPLPERYVVKFIDPEEKMPAESSVRYVFLPPFFPKTWFG